MGLGCSNQRTQSGNENFTFSLKDQELMKKLKICSEHYFKNLGTYQIKKEEDLLDHLLEFGKIYNLPSEFETVATAQLHDHYKKIREEDGKPITDHEFTEIITGLIGDYFRSEILGKILRFETLMKMPRDNDEVKISTHLLCFLTSFKPDTIKNTVAVEYLPFQDSNIFQNGFKL